jgi:hypothetical protein
MEGGSTELVWKTMGASTVRIDPLGKTELSGSRQIRPLVTTTYVMTATKGSATASAEVTVTVTPRPAAPASPAIPAPSPPPIRSAPQPVTGHVGKPVRLEITVIETVRMTIHVDGVTGSTEKYSPGIQTIHADQRIRIRFPNAGAVRFTLNGAALGPVCSRGRICDVEFTPKGARIIEQIGK